MTTVRRTLWYGAGVLLGLLLVYYGKVDPDSGFMPQCVVKRLTGLSCPGCGSQRFVHAMLKGEFAEAVSYNYFLPIGILLIGVCTWLEQTRHKNPARYGRWMRPASIYIVVALMVLWMVVRNVSGI